MWTATAMPDDPWHFGGSTEYPALRYGGHSLTGQGIASPPADLSGLAIAPGRIYEDFAHCGLAYNAVTGPAVTQITVSPAAADGVTLAYRNAADGNLPDRDAGTDGLQTPLGAGENTVKVQAGDGRTYVLTARRAAVLPTVTGTTPQSLNDWDYPATAALDTPAQLSGSTRAAQTLTFSVDDDSGQSPTDTSYWDTMQVWLCTTRAVNANNPTTDTSCVNAGTMSSTGANTAAVSAKLTAAQAANGGVVVKVWDNYRRPRRLAAGAVAAHPAWRTTPRCGS